MKNIKRITKIKFIDALIHNNLKYYFELCKICTNKHLKHFAFNPIKLITILIIFGILFVNPTFGQISKDSANISKNTIYFEALGNGVLYSLNYDRIIFTKNLFQISGRIGFSYIPYLKNNLESFNDIFKYPFEVNVLYGRKSHAEIGLGYTPVFITYHENTFKIYDVYSYSGVRVGYRYQEPFGGFFFRIGFIPYINFPKYLKNSGPKYYLGFGFGYTFMKNNL